MADFIKDKAHTKRKIKIDLFMGVLEKPILPIIMESKMYLKKAKGTKISMGRISKLPISKIEGLGI